MAHPSIADLIRAHKDRTGDSLYDIARRSTSSGYTVSQKYLSKVVLGGARGWPKSRQQFSAIATGLETTELAVVLGYAVELGIPVDMPTVAAQLPAGLDDAPQPQVDALLAMARSIAPRPDAAPSG